MSIEDKYDEVRQLITIGKEKGYLLYDEVNELLRSDITSSDELDDLFSTFGSAGIEVVDSEKTYREDKLLDRTGEGAEELELDLTPGALDKTNDPVRMYLREMGTVPLLTREGEVEIAKRIERGKLAVIKSISRTPTIAKRILLMGDQLRAGERTIRELVIFSDEEITDEVIQERAVEVLEQIEAVRKARANYQKLNEKLVVVPKKDKREYRRARIKSMRGWVEVSRRIREIEFIAQALQIMHGGKHPEVKTPTTLSALARLKRHGLIKEWDADNLVAAYRFFRLVEHRLQMMHQIQTHTLPDSDEEIALLARRTLGRVPEYFKVEQFDVNVEQRYNANGQRVTVAMAVVKVDVAGERLISAAEGNGPVNALDVALRKDLGKYQKYIAGLKLIDYRVRILNAGTEAVTRVLIESEDEVGERWTTVGVSPNIIDASFQALMDSIVFKLVKSGAPA